MSVPKSLLALALLGLAAAQTATAQTTSPGPAATSVEIPGGLRSPERLGTLVRSDTRRFAEPGLGISVTYDGPARATFYIYVRGRDLSRAGAADIVGERDNAASDVSGVARAGGYEIAELRARSANSRLGGIPVATATFKLRRQGQELDSYIIIGFLRRNFVKLRYSAPTGPRTRREAEAVFATFVGAQR